MFAKSKGNGPLVLIEDSYDLNRAYDRSLSSSYSEPQVLHLRLRVIKSDDDVNHFVIKEEDSKGYGLARS